MLKFKENNINLYKKFIIKNKINFFKQVKIITPILNKDIFIHTGMKLNKRNHNCLFINRSVKYNVFFKKPLVSPLKKK